MTPAAPSRLWSMPAKVLRRYVPRAKTSARSPTLRAVRTWLVNRWARVALSVRVYRKWTRDSRRHSPGRSDGLCAGADGLWCRPYHPSRHRTVRALPLTQFRPSVPAVSPARARRGCGGGGRQSIRGETMAEAGSRPASTTAGQGRRRDRRGPLQERQKNPDGIEHGEVAGGRTSGGKVVYFDRPERGPVVPGACPLTPGSAQSADGIACSGNSRALWIGRLS